MGWSCSAEASATLAQIQKVHTAIGGTIKRGETYYFVEASRAEYDDGSITGRIVRLDGVPCVAGNTGKAVGSFRIDGETGQLTRAPKWLLEIVTG